MTSDTEDPGTLLVECSACHQRVSPIHLVRLSGRELCSSCAALWFDEDASDD